MKALKFSVKIQNFDDFSGFCSPEFDSFLRDLTIFRLKCNSKFGTELVFWQVQTCAKFHCLSSTVTLFSRRGWNPPPPPPVIESQKKPGLRDRSLFMAWDGPEDIRGGGNHSEIRKHKGGPP